VLEGRRRGRAEGGSVMKTVVKKVVKTGDEKRRAADARGTCGSGRGLSQRARVAEVGRPAPRRYAARP
jgi:hypothetical protein